MLFMFRRILSKLNNFDVKVYDIKHEMYIGKGSTLLFPKYVDFLCDAKVIKSVFEYLYYTKFDKRYCVVTIIH